MASPGCFATTIELALLPLARAGLLRGPVHVLGITGSSGSGVVPSAGTHHPVRAVNLKSYKLLEHQHTPEIDADPASTPRGPPASGRAGVSAAIRPGVGAADRGESWPPASSSCPPRATADEIAQLYREAYAGEPFVRFLEDRPAEVAAVSGSNYAEVGFTLGEAEGETPDAGRAGGHRQPDQGWRRAGDPEHEPDAGLARDAVARGPGRLAVAGGAMAISVIKLGGDVLEDPARAEVAAGRRPFPVGALPPEAADRPRRRRAGDRAGGAAGREDAAWWAAGGSPTRATLEVLEMVVAGRLNVELCAALRAQRIGAVGLHAGSGVLRARRRPPRVVSGGGPDPIDFGLVGDVVGFDRPLLDTLMARRLPARPVLPGARPKKARCST